MSKEEPIYPSSIAFEKLCREAIEKSTRAIVDSEMKNEIKDDISMIQSSDKYEVSTFRNNFFL